MEDAEIIALYWQRSERAIEESSVKYGAYCFFIANHILALREDAEECVNDTWLHAWNAMPPHRPHKLPVFLGKITRNLAINLYEKLHAVKRGGSQVVSAIEELEECLPGNRSVEEEIGQRQLTEMIDHFLEGVNSEQRKIFVQRYWYMLSVKEIAAENSYSESKVKMTLLRVRNGLREYLKKEGVTV